jgi:prevent-host-death family protein
MASHSVAEARNHLSELIDRALEGEGVVITRHGQPVVELRPMEPLLKTMSAEDLAWLAKRRVGQAEKFSSDAARLVRDMRDEA